MGPHPVVHPDDPACGFDGPDARADGLTKREYLAALNHAAILRAAAFNQGAENMIRKAGIKSAEDTEAFLAMLAVDAADALIAQLNKPKNIAPSSTPSPVQPPC